jgi:dihydropyrimidinase
VKTLIRNGIVCFDDQREQADLLIRDDRIAGVGRGLSDSADVIVDAEGTFVIPGLIDIHTHLDDRIGGYVLADSYRSGTQVAVENGITTIATFVTESAGVRLEEALVAAVLKATDNCYADHWWHLTPIRFDDEGWQAINRCIARGFHLFKFYTTYRQAGIFLDYDQLERIFEHLAGRGVQFLIHCEDDETLAAVHLSDEEWKRPIAHSVSRPEQAEILAIREVVRRAGRQQAAAHIVHVSTPGGLEVIRDARSSVQVSCETCPQYFFLDESWLQREDGHRWICSPPLRSASSREELGRMASHGAVDCFATDHCAFTSEDKDADRTSVRDVPGGVAGIGALAHLVYQLFEQSGQDPILELVRHLAANPARLLGVYRKGSIRVGADADIAMCRISSSARPLHSSRARTHETYPGLNSRLCFERVFLRGEEIVRNGSVLRPEERRGKPLWPM